MTAWRLSAPTGVRLTERHRVLGAGKKPYYDPEKTTVPTPCWLEAEVGQGTFRALYGADLVSL